MSITRHCRFANTGTPPPSRTVASQPVGQILLTVPLFQFATQMLAPSKAIPRGRDPTGTVPRFAPSLARSFVTLFAPEFVTHTLTPSKLIISGPAAVGKTPKLTPSVARILLTLPAS